MSKAYNSDLQNKIAKVESLIQKVNNLPEYSEGVELPELTNEASETEVFEGKEIIDGEGNKKVGTFTIDSELTAAETLVSQIATALEGKAAGGGGNTGAVETCSVRIYSPDSTHKLYSFSGSFYENGQINYKRITTNNYTTTDITFENIVCNTLISVQFIVNTNWPTYEVSGLEHIDYDTNYLAGCFLVKANPQNLAILTLYEDD